MVNDSRWRGDALKDPTFGDRFYDRLSRRRYEAVMKKLIRQFCDDTSGATAIEYCLIAAGISIVIVVAVSGIGTQLNTKFASVNSSLK